MNRFKGSCTLALGSQKLGKRNAKRTAKKRRVGFGKSEPCVRQDIDYRQVECDRSSRLPRMPHLFPDNTFGRVGAAKVIRIKITVATKRSNPKESSI